MSVLSIGARHAGSTVLPELLREVHYLYRVLELQYRYDLGRAVRVLDGTGLYS